MWSQSWANVYELERVWNFANGFTFKEGDNDFIWWRMDVGPDGRVVACEPRNEYALSVYSPDGELLGVIARDEFEPNAKNMDVAVDSEGRIYVADTVTLEIMVFSATDTEASS